MHDLNVINEINARHAPAVQGNAALKAGRFVVAQNSGLHIVASWDFDSRADAESFLASRSQSLPITERLQLHAPEVDSVAA